MKRTRRLLATAVATALALSLSAVGSTALAANSNTGSEMAALGKYVAGNQQADRNWFGGPVYHGEPALAVTAALVKAGGGPENFKFSTALVSMLGEKTVNAEVAKLTKQYGKQRTDAFITGMTFAVKDALKRATEQGIKLPPPADLHGAALAKALVKAGTAPGGTFWAGYLFDHALSHKLHNQVMADIDAKPGLGMGADGDVHMILNQAMYDVAQALGMKKVKLAPFHA